MIWSGRRYNLVGDMNPLVGMPSSFAGEAMGSLEWYSITRPDGSVMIQKREDKKQNKTSTQRASRESQKVWGLLKF